MTGEYEITRMHIPIPTKLLDKLKSRKRLDEVNNAIINFLAEWMES